jgi:Ca2+:H+ antiporter
VYVAYLCFQLKSHAHLYQSTPQEMIDEQAEPGILADVFETSSDSSTSSDDTDTTSGSHSTVKGRIKRAFRNRRRRKSSSNSEGASVPSHLSSPAPEPIDFRPELARRGSAMEPIMSGDEGDHEGPSARFDGAPRVRDFEVAASNSKSPDRVSSPEMSIEPKKRRYRRYRRSKKSKKVEPAEEPVEPVEPAEPEPDLEGHVEFTEETVDHNGGTLSNIQTTGSSKGRIASWRPGLPKLLSQNVFVDPLPSHDRPKLAKASSLPDLSRAHVLPGRGLRAMRIEMPPIKAAPTSDDEEEGGELELSRTAAVVMLLVSTGLVAMCAEFLVDSIPAMTANSTISTEFIGLIILPIVGNAAEHVTAVTVATKNKMDLAIGVAIGSSIQIGESKLSDGTC